MAALKPRLVGLKTALTAKDPIKAASFFAPEVRSRYRRTFESTVSVLPTMAQSLENAKLTMIGACEDEKLDGTIRRIGNLAVTNQGIVFHVTVCKVNGVWMFVTL